MELPAVYFGRSVGETSSGNDEIGSVFDTAADVFLVVGQGAHDIDADDAAV